MPDFRAQPIHMRSLTPDQRFWLKVKKSDGCWEWQGGRAYFGYGLVRIVLPDGTISSTTAHRYAFQSVNGPIPDGMLVCHHCDNPPCVRPDHMFLGTYTDNLRDAQRKGRMPTAKPRVLKGGVRFGERHGHAKLTEAEVRDIRSEYAAGMGSMQDLSRIYAVDISNVHRIIHRKIWKHVA